GQAAALRGARAGRTELELWADIRLAMEAEEGARMPIYSDVTSGVERTAGIGGFPTDRGLEEGDPILIDLAPRSPGYLGDSCNTTGTGEPPAGFGTLYTSTEAAVQTALEQLRPGISMGDLDAAMRAATERLGGVNLIHNGHGIGTGGHEPPRVVPGETAQIRE